MLLDAQRWTGQADAARLVEAAASVPGGAALLVFALFWSPIAAGVPLGVVLALMRIGAIAFGIDVYAAGMLVAALPLPRLAGWAAVIVGDLLWFALVLGASVATAAVVDDSRAVGAAVVVAMVAAPQLAQRLVPALRPARRSA